MKYLLLFSISLWSICSVAQYCGNSGPAICNPNGSTAQGIFTPSYLQIAPLANGQNATVSLQLMMPDSIYFGGTNNSYTDFTIDSISNLPPGMCWSTNKAQNTFLHREHGCIVLSGTPCGANGQYKPRIYGRFTTPSFFLSLLGLSGGDLDVVGFKYILRLKNATDPVTPLDTTQTDSNPVIPYNSAPACSAGLYLTPLRVSSDSVCDGGNVRVSILTNIPFSNANRFSLKVTCTQTGTCNGVWYSDSIYAHQSGTYTFSLPDSITNYAFDCADHDAFNLFLETTDTATETPLGTIVIYGAPAVSWLPSGGVICEGSSLQLGGRALCSQSYKWYQEPAHTLISSASPPYTILPTQTTHYSVHVTRNVCSLDSSFTVTVVPNPVFAPFDTVFATCPHDSVTIGPASIHYLEYVTWSDNNGFFAVDSQVTVLPPFSNIYTATLYDSNACWVQSSVSVSIKEPPYQDICMVTVDSMSNHNVIIWEKYNKPAIDSFYIYREISTNNYAKIAAVHRDSLSEYHDYGANPNSTGYRYRISALDTCGNEGASSLYHNSIHLQYLGGGNLQWNNYEIEFSSTPVASYDILRDDNGTGAWSQILNVSGTQNTASDPNFTSYPNARYKVIANWPFSCTPSRAYQMSLSNVIASQANGIQRIDEMSFRITPNPTRDWLHIAFPKLVSGFLTVTDITGKELIVTDIKASVSETIDARRLPAGIYIATFKNADCTYSQKVVKE
ncbi:MAG: hypothetical protein JWO03_3931 [Bacteroidetes bacterium]|nr:hypothetical protein [Bacteroidota bacterium]